MDLHLRIANDLAFTFEGLSEELAQLVRGFCGHSVCAYAVDGAMAVRTGSAPPAAVGAGEPVLIEGPLVIRRAEGRVLLELPGIVAWCDPEIGGGGLVVEDPSPDVIEAFTTRALPVLLFELAVTRGWLGLHAAAIAIQGRAILLPGPSGSGKTTLFCAANRAGLGVLSDDMAWLREQDEIHRVVAFPRGAPLAPVPRPTTDDLPLEAIVVPAIVERGPSRLRAVSASDAVRELVAQSTFLGYGPRDSARFRHLVRAAAAVPAFRLEAGPDGDAVEVLVAALR